MTMAQPIAPPERSTTTLNSNAPGLTTEQIETYRRNGFIGPLTLCTPEAMAELREWIDAEDFLSRPSPLYEAAPLGMKAVVQGLDYEKASDWHLVYRQIYALCTHPTVTAAMASLMGPDLLLWRSHLQLKEARVGKPVAWHRDRSFPGQLGLPALNPVKNISAWIAIDRADVENGCVWCVPGTHKQNIPVRRGELGADEEGLFGRRYKLEYVVDTTTAVPMVLDPGQYFLFTESTLHGSPHNPSPRRRTGFSVRVTTPEVRVYDGQSTDGQGYKLDRWGCVLMSGEDRYGYNKIIEPRLIG